MPGLQADIHAPVRPGNYPVIALVYGGGWTLGDRTQLSGLAGYLASAGMVVINGEHRTLLWGRQLPDMVGEVNCLAAAAPHLAAPHLTRPAGPVWLLGFSSGAHLAAVSTVGDSRLPGQCPYAPAKTGGMIGLAGPYDLDQLWNQGVLTSLLDSEALREHLPQVAVFLEEQNRAAMQLFLRLLTGATPDAPELWNSLNPIHLTLNHPSRSFLLITGAQDQVISPSHTSRFAEALTADGHRVITATVAEADHFALTDPGMVADLILAFIRGSE